MIIFGLAYLTGTIHAQKDPVVMLPVLGPMIAAANYDCPRCLPNQSPRPILIAIGVTQTVGAGLIALAAAFEVKRFLRQDLAGATFEVTPAFSADYAGCAFASSF